MKLSKKIYLVDNSGNFMLIYSYIKFLLGGIMDMKKLLAGALTATMLFSSMTALAVDYGAEYQKLPTPQTVQKFSDVPSTHWAFDYIGEMAQRNVISGYPDGRFIPENQVTRAEFAKIMVCAAGLRVNNNNTTSFNDVYTSDWYCPYVECAKDYLTGYTTNTGTIYKPTTPALREDIAVALVKLKGYDISLADESILNMFTDSYSISSSARKYVAVAVERGIVSGYEDNTFRGQATITRAEAATLLWRAFQYGNDNKVVDTSGSGIQNSGATVPGNETAVPTPTPTVQGNSGTVSSNNGAVSEPTPTIEPTVEPTEKPYKVDTLVKADVKEATTWSRSKDKFRCMTSDGNGTIYYVADNKVYSVNSNGNVNEILNIDELSKNNDFDEETFDVSALVCDTNGNLYIRGKYSSNGSPSIYAVKNGSIDLVAYGDDGDNIPRPLLILDDSNYVMAETLDGHGSGAAYLSTFGSNNCEYIAGNNVISATESKGNIIVADNNAIYSYDYNTTTKIANSTNNVGLSNTSYVIAKDNEFIIRNYDGTNEIRINKDDYEIKDKKSFNTSSIADKMFLTSNNNIIFYDTNAKAFRMISENK